MSRRYPLRITLALLGLVVAGCSRAGVTGPAEQPPLPPAVASLTGVSLDDHSVAERPVVATKIENLPAAGPLFGIDAADVVFEALVEGGITRFLVLYQSTVPDRVGPIRSARPEDAAVLPAFQPVFFFTGARPDVITALEQTRVVLRQEEGPVLRRDRSGRAPHNVFASGVDLFAAAADEAPAAKPIGWAFADQPPPGPVVCQAPCPQDPAAPITIPMSHVSRAGFQYDPPAGVYRRLRNGGPQQFAAPVGVANVVVLAMRTRAGGCCDPAGNPFVATEVVGSGRGVVLRDGQRYEVGWAKPSPDGQFAITRPNGTPFPLKPGPSWVLFAPASAVP